MATPSCVLLVEDDDDTRQLVRELLQEEGFRVEAAKDSTEALALVPKCRPDLIVLDFYLPEADGTEVLAQLRKASKVTVPVVVISGAERVDVPGISAWVNKPFHRETLIGTVRKHLGAGKAR